MENKPKNISPKPTYWLTRFMILRLLGLVYFVAFLSLAQQLKPLIGERGLTPTPLFLYQFQAEVGSWGRAFFDLPSVFWFGHSDSFMVFTAWLGVFLSFLVLAGFANGLLLLLLWALYMSFVHVGQDWYGYGWEIQLLETGFLAVFLVPFLDGRPFPRTAPPMQVIWLFRWLIFRIMIGAGLIKLRGDPCWRDLTCLQYHYETQPIPNPLSPYFHFMPPWFHKAGALYNHLAELGMPWLMVMGRMLRTIAGSLMGVFQVILILSGNLSFLNWLTLIPILSCFDDGFWSLFLPRFLVEKANIAINLSKESPFYNRTAWGLTALVLFLSINPVSNLISSNQAMNTSFDRLHLVNTYGAFGSVGRERLQLVVEGTSDRVLTQETLWKPYEFKAQPGDLYRRPCVCAPYQFRLDWQIWFAAMSEPSQYPWVYNLVWKLLHKDPETLSLFAGNPFPGVAPAYIRIRVFHYQFAPLSHPLANGGKEPK
jgi:hypothetical protein